MLQPGSRRELESRAWSGGSRSGVTLSRKLWQTVEEVAASPVSGGVSDTARPAPALSDLPDGSLPYPSALTSPHAEQAVARSGRTQVRRVPSLPPVSVLTTSGIRWWKIAPRQSGGV